jgi:hypothetical protein
MPSRDDLGGHPGVVEGVERVLVDHEVTPPRSGLQLLDVVEQRAVRGEEGVAGVPVALHQGVP